METTTNKSTELITATESKDLETIMNLKHAAYLKNRSFVVFHERTSSDIEASITLKDQKQTFYYKVEAKVSLKNLAPKDKEALFIMLDYLDIYFDEYLKGEEDVYIPIDWSEFTFENLTFKMKGQVQNLHAEKIADEFLEKNTVQAVADTLN